jgi:GNAT superfamily N-acetyltransferase
MDTLAEILLQTYPRSATLEDGTAVTLRPLMKTDEAALLDYARSLPREDRLYLKQDVTDPKIIVNWIYELDYDAALPLVALHHSRIVGVVTVHFNPMGSPRHQGEVRLTTSGQYRRKGLGTRLVQDIIDLAGRLGLERLNVEMPRFLEDAVNLFEHLGFKAVAHLEGFVRDPEGRESALVLMTKHLAGPA